MKKILAKLFAFVVLALAMTPYVSAAQSINAEISPFTHKLVYTDFYNFATEYPVLLYKNITYIPMTSSMCNELYLSIAFTPEDGLYIARGGGRGNIGQERVQVLGSIDYKNPASGRVTAVIPEYPVYINGRGYQSTEYPCLNFRGVTYLPLTYDIIANEFDFDFAFDGDKKHIELAGNSWYSAPNFLSSNEEYIEIKDSRSVYSESTDENGYIKYTHEYDYDVYYRLNLKNDRVERLPDGYVPPKQESTVSAKEPDPRFTIKDGYAYFEDIQLVKIPSISGTGYHYSGYANAEIHDFGDASIIVVTTGVNIALPRGTTRKHHIFVKDENGIIKLDFNGRFSELFRGENGDFYIVSSSEESSYGNYFSEIYRYTKENGLERLSDRYENLNSLEYIGRKDGKIYVFGALRDGNREIAYSGESLNPMYSGYYVIDENLNITKISPFIGTRANVILAENGCLYAITNTSQNNKLVNLTTGEILISGI